MVLFDCLVNHWSCTIELCLTTHEAFGQLWQRINYRRLSLLPENVSFMLHLSILDRSYIKSSKLPKWKRAQPIGLVRAILQYQASKIENCASGQPRTKGKDIQSYIPACRMSAYARTLALYSCISLSSSTKLFYYSGQIIRYFVA